METAKYKEQFVFSIWRAIYYLRKGPAFLIPLLALMGIPFVWSKGAGTIYLDMLGILFLVFLVLWYYTSLVHGNQKILFYAMILLITGTMLQSVFIAEQLVGYPDSAGDVHPALHLQVQYLAALLAAVLAGFLYYRCKEICSARYCRWIFAGWLFLSFLALLSSYAVSGVKNWIFIGPLSIQTTELGKLSYLFCAACLFGGAGQEDRKTRLSFYLITAITEALLVLQGEFGTFLLILMLFFTILILCVSEIRVILSAAGLTLSMAASVFLAGFWLSARKEAGLFPGTWKPVRLFLSHYEKIASRFIYWLHPEKDAAGLGYQLLKAKESILLGGWFGTSSITDLPVHTSDLVYPALIERCGLVFALLVFVLFVMLWLEGIRVSVRKEDPTHKIVAASASFMLFDQSLIIIAGSTGLCPLTGITLPFISSGGTSLLVSFVLVVLLITASGHVTWKGEEIEQEAFFKKSPIFTKLYAGSGYSHSGRHHKDVGRHSRHIQEGGSAEACGKEKGVSERICPGKHS